MRRLADKRIQFSTESRSSKGLPAGMGRFFLCLAGLLLSICFPMAEKQFIAIALLAGIRWALTGRNNEVKIIIIERR